MKEITRKANKNEINKIFNKLAEERERKFEVKPEISDVMQEMWLQKQERNLWRRGQTSSAPD